MINKPAPLAPELAYKQDQMVKKKQKGKAISNEPSADDDFAREMLFYRQAQAAVLEALPRLKSMGISTKRPDDYFAQMAKTDRHMQKVSASNIFQRVSLKVLQINNSAWSTTLKIKYIIKDI